MLGVLFNVIWYLVYLVGFGITLYVAEASFRKLDSTAHEFLSYQNSKDLSPALPFILAFGWPVFVPMMFGIWIAPALVRKFRDWVVRFSFLSLQPSSSSDEEFDDDDEITDKIPSPPSPPKSVGVKNTTTKVTKTRTSTRFPYVTVETTTETKEDGVDNEDTPVSIPKFPNLGADLTKEMERLQKDFRESMETLNKDMSAFDDYDFKVEEEKVPGGSSRWTVNIAHKKS
jgi:hypothetical protein